MITFTWWGAATIAAIMTGTGAFIAYWSGYQTAINNTKNVVRKMRDDIRELEDAIDDLEDHISGRPQTHRLTNAEHDMFRSIIRYNSGS